jgi:3,4-dihydroxy-2-butanone 4-phosphate synthase
MTSKSDIEKMFKEAAAELERPSPLKELTSSIINIERKHIYGDASASSRLKTIRELIEAARKKGDLC